MRSRLRPAKVLGREKVVLFRTNYATVKLHGANRSWFYGHKSDQGTGTSLIVQAGCYLVEAEFFPA